MADTNGAGQVGSTTGHFGYDPGMFHVLDGAPRGRRATVRYNVALGYLAAMADISNATSFGRRATCTVARAGGLVVK